MTCHWNVSRNILELKINEIFLDTINEVGIILSCDVRIQKSWITYDYSINTLLKQILHELIDSLIFISILSFKFQIACDIRTKNDTNFWMNMLKEKKKWITYLNRSCFLVGYANLKNVASN